MRIGWILPLGFFAGCEPGDSGSDLPGTTQQFTQSNSGDGTLEGHTPRGFQGQGAGIFTGDEINPNFPDDDGVQIFLTVPLDANLSDANIINAEFTAVPTDIQGDPFATLGALLVDEVQFDEFSSALWDTQPVDGGVSCVLATSEDDDFTCDLTQAVQRAVDAQRDVVNVRIRFETPSDADGSADLVLFHAGDTNATAPGLVTLRVEAELTP